MIILVAVGSASLLTASVTEKVLGHQVENCTRFPLQHINSTSSSGDAETDRHRRDFIRNMTRSAWTAYEQNAWGGNFVWQLCVRQTGTGFISYPEHFNSVLAYATAYVLD